MTDAPTARSKTKPLSGGAHEHNPVWRRGARQVALAQLLRGVEEVPLTPKRARAVGALLLVTRSADVVDAAVVELAATGDEILTSDPEDILRIAQHSGRTLIVTPVG